MPIPFVYISEFNRLLQGHMINNKQEVVRECTWLLLDSMLYDMKYIVEDWQVQVLDLDHCFACFMQ